MTGLALARRTAVRYRARTILAVVGVAVIAALNFDMLLLSRGLLLSFADMIASGGFDVRVTGGTGVPAVRLPVTGASKLVADIRKLPQVDDVVQVRLDQATAVIAGRPDQGVTLVGTNDSPSHPLWTMVSGRTLDPSAAGSAPEVIVARRVSEAFGIQPGGTLRLRPGVRGERSTLPAVDCRVVGVADFSLETAGGLTVTTTLDGLREIQGHDSDDADALLVASRPEAGGDAAAVAAIAPLRSDLWVYSNAELVEQFNRNGFAYFRQISLVLSTTTAVFTFLLVAVLLTVSVNQRLGQIAALRAIGISRQRVATMLLWESGLLVGIGGLLALPLGWGMASYLDEILRRMPGLPERLHFFVFEPRALYLHAGLLAVTALVAAAYPMWLAVTLPIAPTLRREVVS